jgi:hypothetical protein
VTFKVEGMSEALANLEAEINAIEGKTIGGLLGAGMIVLGEAQKRVPVEYGNLRASGYVHRSAANAKAVDVGFTAAYAFYVHENLEQKLKGLPRKSGIGVYWGPRGQPKFLTAAALEKGDEIVKYVADRAET